MGTTNKEGREMKKVGMNVRWNVATSRKRQQMFAAIGMKGGMAIMFSFHTWENIPEYYRAMLREGR